MFEGQEGVCFLKNWSLLGMFIELQGKHTTSLSIKALRIASSYRNTVGGRQRERGKAIYFLFLCCRSLFHACTLYSKRQEQNRLPVYIQCVCFMNLKIMWKQRRVIPSNTLGKLIRTLNWFLICQQPISAIISLSYFIFALERAAEEPV